MNIQEDYVSFEIAKLLKEKGFDLYEVREWVAKPQDKSTLERDSFPTLEDFIESEDFVELPITSYHYPLITLQMAMKWLREVHNICITIYPIKGKGYEAVLYDIKDDVEIILQSFGIYGSHIFRDSYEQACEAAIEYYLENLI